CPAVKHVGRAGVFQTRVLFIRRPARTMTIVLQYAWRTWYLGPSIPSPMSKQPKSTVVAPLSTLLASSYTLYLKTHNYHWNVTGPMFTTLHTLFMTQYTELALAV